MNTDKNIPVQTSACISNGTSKHRIACVGDSITFGCGIDERERFSYPSQLKRMLGDEYEVGNFGCNGATALRGALRTYCTLPEFSDALAFNPTIVVIKLGTNDSGMAAIEGWAAFAENFVSDYLALLSAFQKLESNPQIFVALPIPIFSELGIQYAGNNPVEGLDLDSYEKTLSAGEGIISLEIKALLHDVASSKGLDLIDFFALFEGKPAMTYDGVHPNKEGAKLMAEEAARVLKLRCDGLIVNG